MNATETDSPSRARDAEATTPSAPPSDFIRALVIAVAESFGLSALEAQACGCPVIGYRAGGLPEVVVDQETGILCPEKEHVCLGSLTADLLADRQRYRLMREASRINAERFAKGPVVDRYEKALCCLVNSDRVCGAATMADCAHA